jgi:hypothetical protein
VSREWYRWFYNLYTVTGGGLGITPVANGGTGLASTPTNGQLLIGNGTGYTLNTLSAGTNIAVANGAGTISVSFTGILAPTQGGTGLSATPPFGSILIGDGLNYSIGTVTAGAGIYIDNDGTNISIALAGGGYGGPPGADGQDAEDANFFGFVPTQPAGSTTQVQYNNGGTFGASSNFTYTSGTNTLTTGNITGSALGMTIQPLAPTSGSAGALTVQARAGVATNGAGGAVNLTAGAGVGTGNGGAVSLTSGTGRVGGSMAFTAGQGTGGGGGSMQFTAGQSSSNANAGDLSFTAGECIGGAFSGFRGGNLSFASGTSSQGPAGSFYCLTISWILSLIGHYNINHSLIM